MFRRKSLYGTTQVSLAPHGGWSAVVTAVPTAEETVPTAAFIRAADGEVSPSDRRRRDWVAKIPVVQMGNHPSSEPCVAAMTMVHDTFRAANLVPHAPCTGLDPRLRG